MKLVFVQVYCTQSEGGKERGGERERGGEGEGGWERETRERERLIVCTVMISPSSLTTCGSCLFEHDIT